MRPEEDILHGLADDPIDPVEIVELDDTPDERSAIAETLQLPLGVIQAASRQIFDSLPFAVTMTDAAGYLTYFNTAAIEFSGRLPSIGRDQWCVCWKLYAWSGDVLPHDESPMALTIRSGKAFRNVRSVAERPNGIRVPFMSCPTPLTDINGKLIGAFNMLVPVRTVPKWFAEWRT